MIENYSSKNIKPASINIHLNKIFKIENQKIINFSKKIKYKELKLPYILKPNEYILAKSKEILNIPQNVCILHIHRTTTMRRGLNIIGGFGDPGYKGEIYYGIKNIGNNNIELNKNDSLTKIIFLSIDGKTIPLITKYLGGRI